MTVPMNISCLVIVSTMRAPTSLNSSEPCAADCNALEVERSREWRDPELDFGQDDVAVVRAAWATFDHRIVSERFQADCCCALCR